MSSLDPFGKQRGPAFGPRGGNGDIGHTFTHAAGVVQSVYSQLSDRNSRGWNRTFAIASVVNALLAVLYLGWWFWTWTTDYDDFHSYILVTGILLLGLGGAGLTSFRTEAVSLKTLCTTLAVLAAVASWTYISQVTADTQHECLLAETYLRIEHVENVLFNMKHEETMNAIVGRLNALHNDIIDVQFQSQDHVSQSQEQIMMKDRDAQFLDEKLSDLLTLADEAIDALDQQMTELQKNVTTMESVDVEEIEDRSGKLKHKARLRSLKYQVRALEPKKAALQAMIQKVERHQQTGVSGEDYQELLRILDRNVRDEQLRSQVESEKGMSELVTTRADRYMSNDYVNMVLDEYRERAEQRESSRSQRRERFEKEMQDIVQSRKTNLKLTSREMYLRSVSNHMEKMPDHCEELLDTITFKHAMSYVAMFSALFSAYAALTSSVVAVKKEF